MYANCMGLKTRHGFNCIRLKNRYGSKIACDWNLDMDPNFMGLKSRHWCKIEWEKSRHESK